MSQYYYNPANATPQSGGYMQPINPAGGQKLKETIGSILFLVAVIAFSISIVLSIIAALLPNPFYATIFNQIQQYLPSDFPTEALNPQISQMGSVIGTIFGSFINILLCIGMWLAYFSAKKGQVPALSTAGYSIVRGVNIYNLVMIIIAGVGVLLIAVLGVSLFSLAAYRSTELPQLSQQGQAGLTAVIVVILIIAALILVLAILYVVKTISSWGVIKTVAEKGYRDKKNISLYVIVFNYIALIFVVISIVSELFSALSSGGSAYSLVSLLQQILNLVYVLLLTIVLSKLRNELEPLNRVPMPGGTTYNPYAGAYSAQQQGAANTQVLNRPNPYAASYQQTQGAAPGTPYTPYTPPTPSAQPFQPQPSTPIQAAPPATASEPKPDPEKKANEVAEEIAKAFRED